MITIDLRKKGLAGRVRIDKPTWQEIAAAVVVIAGAVGLVWLLVG